MSLFQRVVCCGIFSAILQAKPLCVNLTSNVSLPSRNRIPVKISLHKGNVIGKESAIIRNFLSSHEEILKFKFSDSERATYLQFYKNLKDAFEKEDLRLIFDSYSAIDRFHQSISLEREAAHLKKQTNPEKATYEQYIGALKNQILFSEEFMFLIAEYVEGKALTMEKGLAYAARLHRLMKKYLQGKGEKFREVMQNRGESPIPILIIEESSNPYIPKIRDVAKKAHGKEVDIVYSPIGQFYSGHSEWIATHEQGISGKTLLIPKEKIILNDEGHEFRHGYIQHLLERGIQSLYHGDIVTFGQGNKIGVNGYSEALSFEEISTYGFDVRASIPRFRNVSSHEEFIKERKRLEGNIEKGKEITKGVSSHLSEAEDVLLEFKNELTSLKQKWLAVDMELEKSSLIDPRPTLGKAIVPGFRELNFEGFQEKILFFSVVESDVETGNPKHKTRWVKITIGNKGGPLTSLYMLNPEALKAAEKVLADSSEAVLPDYFTLMEFTQKSLEERREKFEAQGKEFERLEKKVKAIPMQEGLVNTTPLIESVQSFKLLPIR